MGLESRNSGGKDDFVLTISDNDDSLPLETEEDDSPSETPPKQLQSSTKRKRGVEVPATNGTSKKAKKQKKQKGNHIIERGVSVEEENQTWAAGGKDDGAMDSDFEFQVGDVNDGVVEDFDAWGPNGDTTGKSGADNKGVDIEELVARRRSGGRVEREQPESNDDNGEIDTKFGGHGASEGGGEEDLLASGPKDSASEEEDETLAEDGFGMGATGSDEEDLPNGMMENGQSEATSDAESIAEPVPHPEDEATEASSVDEKEDPEEHARREAFFAPSETPTTSTTSSFQSMSLSRPILRGLASLSFTTPTPIQQKTIPIALLGRDVVGGAVTGSGKTAAFIIPILERLLYRPKKVPTSRVAILMPTRELAVQCFTVARKLASYTDITFAQLVGGFSLREQEAVLRSRPDIIIATPGRFIDHMRNSASFTLDTLEILVLDEADRMLEDGFADELNEILTTIPKSRQTMLFSATMTSRVDALIRLGLQRPVRLVINEQEHTTVGTLVQEFVRLRPGREEKRLAYLLHLCMHTYTSRVIIFFRQKSLAHRVRIIFALLDLRAAELHGSMTQEQRIASLTSFRAGTANYLLATDVASRGLDIPAVSTVINYTAPQNSTIYLHRVGRTARAGREGRACTLAAEPDRKVVKEIVKAAKAQGAKVVSRTVDAAAVDALATRIEALEGEIEAVLREEKEERALRGVELQVRKGENLMEHETEIRSRPKRTWFESEKEKQIAKKKGLEELNGAVRKKVVGGKLSNKDKKRLDDTRERKEGVVWKKGKGDVRGGPERPKSKVKKEVKGGGGGGGGKSKGKAKAKGGKRR